MLNRTQVMLDEQLKNNLQLIAINKGISMSQVIRELLAPLAQKEYQKTKNTQNTLTARKFFERMQKHSVWGPGDSEYDTYAYDLKTANDLN